MRGLIITNNNRERSLRGGISRALSHRSRSICNYCRRDTRITNLHQKTLNPGQKLHRRIRQCRTHLTHQPIINLLIRQVHPALTQPIQRELHGITQAIQGVLRGPHTTKLRRQLNLRGCPHRLSINQRAIMIKKNRLRKIPLNITVHAIKPTGHF